MECTPELRPLMEWLGAHERVEPCPAELLPPATREQFEQYFGPADTYIVIPGVWVIPYAEPHNVIVYRRGTHADELIGMTRVEVEKRFEPAGGPYVVSPTLEQERANFKRLGIPDETTNAALPIEFQLFTKFP